MKYLSHYKEKATTALLESNGAFFAFGQSQFDDKKQSGVKYVSCGNGLIIPKTNVDVVLKGLDSIHKEGIEMDLAENGKDGVIQRELANHEAQISCDISDTVDALVDYGITEQEVREGYKVYFENCVKQDLF